MDRMGYTTHLAPDAVPVAADTVEGAAASGTAVVVDMDAAAADAAATAKPAGAGAIPAGIMGQIGAGVSLRKSVVGGGPTDKQKAMPKKTMSAGDEINAVLLLVVVVVVVKVVVKVQLLHQLYTHTSQLRYFERQPTLCVGIPLWQHY
jgi:hypothetical protein